MKGKQNSQGKESIRTGTSPEILSQALLDNLYYGQGRTPELATRNAVAISTGFMETFTWKGTVKRKFLTGSHRAEKRLRSWYPKAGQEEDE